VLTHPLYDLIRQLKLDGMLKGLIEQDALAEVAEDRLGAYSGPS